MSSTERAAPKPYFCYQCVRTVSISISPSSDPVCPICNGGFLEEFENPNPNPNPVDTFFSDPFFSPFGSPLIFSSSSSSSGGIDLQPPPSDTGPFNPVLFLQNHLQSLMAGGANIQFVVENSSDSIGGSGAFRLPASFGDYFLGPGLEQLIQQLAENDPNRYGTPPAAKSAIESLPSVKVSEKLLVSDSAQCAVCMDLFELGAEGKEMPCKHIFHPDCILPWLDLHNSCPVCRYELPTDDPDYERRVRGAPPPPPATANQAAAANTASGSAGGGMGQGESGPTTPTTERRFRISLPWPVRVLRTPADTSNSGNNNDNRNDGERNLNSGTDSGPEARQEDLD
ncbi:hypothetical protein AAC387_Pa11g1578 [Persea americana]